MEFSKKEIETKPSEKLTRAMDKYLKQKIMTTEQKDLLFLLRNEMKEGDLVSIDYLTVYKKGADTFNCYENVINLHTYDFINNEAKDYSSLEFVEYYY